MNLNKLLFISLLFIANLSGNNIEINTINKPTNILKNVEIYIDKDNKNNFEYIQKNSASLFKKNSNKLLHLGYSTDGVWLKFSIQNSSDKEIKKVLVISNNMLDNIDLYTKEENSYTKTSTGVFSDSIFNESVLKFYFNLLVEKGETREYYLRVSSLSSALYFDLKIMDKDELYQAELQNQLILALFFGAIISLIIYNLFIYFFTKDVTYLYYSLYQFFVIWNHSSYSGMSLYLLPIEYLETDAYLSIFYLSSLIFFALLFTRKLLDIQKHKRIDFIIKILLFTSIVLVVFTSPDFYPLEMVVVTLLFSLSVMVLISFYFLYKKVTNAKYIVVGWSIALFGWIMLGTKQLGVWTLLDTYPYFYEFSMFVEAILFSIALASKLNKTKELENSVATNAILTRELHHRVKNNMQFIISMYRLKLAKYENKDISESLKEVEGTIQAMSATHEMLYSQKVVSNLDTKEYFTTLLNRLKSSYKNTNVEISLDIEIDIDIDSSIYVGIILNELMTNSFKYAFKENGGQIIISLSRSNALNCLVVKDNGIGFKSSDVQNTFGLELVSSLVEDELGGTIISNTRNGVEHKIQW